ncbi:MULTISPECIES: DMT family transporter [unclassified Agarivorans]|uniref:DMT family transporter n=1 Tax=unclassified Agarivorans TaxID=2636026 RepID=UPI0026E36E4B|nr:MULTISPECIES: DMT family transporter [unclassified Agarivorans]MDO6684096.1 DMT family transporter [Agarivorans sp. 3_MG-2023]MDO6714170.1 DMT family transporter [Agarivorans sp. 2_MG-2023]
MFFIIALSATFAYALQGVLMAKVYRQSDPLSAVAYRGLSLLISMSPLLLLVPRSAYADFVGQTGYLVLAASLAALGNWANAIAFVRLPVGIASALSMAFTALFVALLGQVFLDERLSAQQWLMGGFTLVAVLLLGASQARRATQVALQASLQYKPLVGILASAGYGALMSCALILVASMSRSSHPFLVGYAWEVMIGVMAMLMAFGRGLFTVNNGFQGISFTHFKQILIYASPTVIGTGCYALAMTLGPLAIAAAILSTMMVFSMVLGLWLLGEKPSTKQWLMMSLVCMSVIGLKLVA